MTTGPSEATQAYVVPGTIQAHDDGTTTVEAVSTPTQVRRPWKATIRTAFQTGLAFATLVPFVVTGVYTDADATPAIIGQVVVVAGTITRVMALPQVEKFLQDWVPWLAAAPAAISSKEG